MALRTWQVLNGCHASLDWTNENCTVATIRLLAPSFRMAYFLTGIYMVIISEYYLKWPLIFRYDLFTSDNAMKPGNATLNICMMMWAFDFAFLSMAFFFVRLNAKGDWNLFSSVTGYRPRECILRVVYSCIFLSVAVVGVISTHTVLSHMWRAQNVWFAALLLLQCIMLVISSLGDIVDSGSPWGIQEASRLASVLLCVRSFVLVPITVIFSLASVFASWPPSYCAQC